MKMKMKMKNGYFIVIKVRYQVKGYTKMVLKKREDSLNFT